MFSNGGLLASATAMALAASLAFGLPADAAAPAADTAALSIPGTKHMRIPCALFSALCIASRIGAWVTEQGALDNRPMPVAACLVLMPHTVSNRLRLEGLIPDSCLSSELPHRSLFSKSLSFAHARQSAHLPLLHASPVHARLGIVGDSPLREGLVSGFLLIFFSEIGDKTFFIALLLALKQPKSLVFTGTFGALAVMTVVSVLLGQVRGRVGLGLGRVGWVIEEELGGWRVKGGTRPCACVRT